MIAITASLDKQTGVTPIDDEWVLGDIHDIIVILVEYACGSSVATIARVGGYAGTSVGIYIGLIVVRFVGDADGVLIDSVGAIVRFAVGAVVIFVGNADGALVDSVGDSVGATVRFAVGAVVFFVGNTDGGFVETSVGVTVGDSVTGLFEGEFVGEFVGELDGAAVNVCEGRSVEEFVG